MTNILAVSASIGASMCIERVHRPARCGIGKATQEPCRNRATYRVDGLGRFGALYSDVPMCSVHRSKYDRAGYRSWPIGADREDTP